MVNPTLLRRTCSALVLPIVEVAPNVEIVLPPTTISKLLESILEKLLSSNFTFTSKVEAEICEPAVSPIIAPVALNEPTTVEPSLIVTPAELIDICSFDASPIRVIAPNSATLVPAVTTSTPSDFTNT